MKEAEACASAQKRYSKAYASRKVKAVVENASDN
jgi:hypothetical protein